MRRRQALSLAGLGLLAGTPGCARVLGTRLPDGMAVETRHWSSRILTFYRPNAPAELRYPEAPERDENPYTAVFTGVPEALERLVPREYTVIEEAAEFVRETDFDRSFLVVLDWEAGSSSYTLVLDRIRRTDDGLHLDVRIEKPRHRLSDLSPHTLAVRITDGGGPPATVSAGVHESEVHRLVDRVRD